LSRKMEIAYLASVGIIASVILWGSIFLNADYYTRNDLFGPVSKFPILFVGLAIGISMTMAYAFLTSREEDLWKLIVLLLPLVLLIIYLLVLPDAIEKFYVTNFEDVYFHMERTMYVVNVGKTTSLDSYFDLQPGVFYSAASFLIVTGLPPLLIFKWFPLFFVTIALVPSLLFLGKSFFANRRNLIVFVFVALASTWVSGRYHYSAQIYSLPLYFILVAFLLRGLKNRSQLFVVTILAVALIVVHQGVALVTLTTLIALLLFRVMDTRVLHRLGHSQPYVASFTLSFLIVWFGYLALLTVHTLARFLAIATTLATVILANPLTYIFNSLFGRPSQSLPAVILYGKLALAIITYSLALPTSIYLWIRKRDGRMGAVFIIILAVSVVIIGLGFAVPGSFGGGYVERAFLFGAPLLAVPITFLLSRLQKMRSPLPAVALLILTLMGTMYFNSSRNFEAVMVSEQACNQYLQYFAPVYQPYIPRTTAQYGYYLYGTQTSRPSPGFYMLWPTDVISSSYWLSQSDLSNVFAGLNNGVYSLRFYSNGQCTLYSIS